jgi:uncharacterized protein
MGLQSLVRFLVPREEHFFDFLEKQAAVAHEGACALAESAHLNVSSVRDSLSELEHRGDDIVDQMDAALARTFVTPIDREDLHRLSSELDDVLDLANAAARAMVLFAVDRPSPAMIRLMGVLVECTERLSKATPSLRKHDYPALTEAARDVKKLEKEADLIFRDAISELFHDPKIDAKEILRQKEILDDVERSIDRCDHVATTLANLAVKHG